MDINIEDTTIIDSDTFEIIKNGHVFNVFLFGETYHCMYYYDEELGEDFCFCDKKYELNTGYPLFFNAVIC